MKRLSILTAGLLLLTACGKELPTAPDTKGEIVFLPTLETPVKVTDSAFEEGDEIGVFITRNIDGKAPVLQIGGNFASNVSLALNGGQWTCSPKLYWEDGTFHVYAYYPKSDVPSVEEYPFRVQANQSRPATDTQKSAYEQSDFLLAITHGVTGHDPVPLVFKHKMSKINVRLIKGPNYEGDLPEDATVYIHNTVQDALVDFSTGDVIKNPTALSRTMTMLQNGVGSYTAIMVPQMLTNRVPLFEVVSKGVSYLIESKFQFKSGVCHTVNITLDDNPDRVKIDIGGEIIGWN